MFVSVNYRKNLGSGGGSSTKCVRSFWYSMFQPEIFFSLKPWAKIELVFFHQLSLQENNLHLFKREVHVGLAPTEIKP